MDVQKNCLAMLQSKLSKKLKIRKHWKILQKTFCRELI